MSESSPAPITTFYSYKGGVGRSMALANVAQVLAERYGKRVLMIDWDLEAPGLHRFFRVDDQQIKKGLLDMIDDYKQMLRTADDSLPQTLVNVDDYLTPIRRQFSGKGSLKLLAAGRQDKGYAARVNEFSWEDFYKNWHGLGFISHLRDLLQKAADIVLVDSRTGVTDIGGICTLQLPDAVVLLFAMNEQSLAGTDLAIQSIQAGSPEVKREQPPIVILRPARVERTGSQDRKIEWEKKAADRLGGYLSELEQGDALLFMKKRNIPYIGDYSYGEVPLAVEKDPYGDLAEAFHDLAKSVLIATKLWTGELPDRTFERPKKQVAVSSFQLLQALWLGVFVGLLPYLLALPGLDLVSVPAPLGKGLLAWGSLATGVSAALVYWFNAGRPEGVSLRKPILLFVCLGSAAVIVLVVVQALVVIKVPAFESDVNVLVGFGVAGGCAKGVTDLECVQDALRQSNNQLRGGSWRLSSFGVAQRWEAVGAKLWGASNFQVAQLVLVISYLLV